MLNRGYAQLLLKLLQGSHASYVATYIVTYTLGYMHG